MNVYDFDKTIYLDDSSLDFYLFNLKRNPKLAKYWPRQLNAAKDYKLKVITKTQMKDIFYEYLKDVDDIHGAVKEFWKKHKHKIMPWYLEQKDKSDVIISASPEFLLKPICDSLGVNLIGSIVEIRTGKNLRENCFGSEKVNRFKEQYDLNEIDNFYSDSYSDDPLAQYAKKAFLVHRGSLKPW